MVGIIDSLGGDVKAGREESRPQRSQKTSEVWAGCQPALQLRNHLPAVNVGHAAAGVLVARLAALVHAVDRRSGAGGVGRTVEGGAARGQGVGRRRAAVVGQGGEDGVEANDGHDVGRAGGQADQAGVAAVAKDVEGVAIEDREWKFIADGRAFPPLPVKLPPIAFSS